MPRVFDPDNPELMDRPQPVTEELRRDLENLRSLNQHFGAHRIVRRFLKSHFKAGRCIRILDLCTGSADIPRLAVDLGRRTGCEVAVDAIDFQSSTAQIAAELCDQGYPEISVHVGDAITWTPPQPPDLVLCSLALHHFSDNDAISLLARCRTLPRIAALVADLRRSWMTSLGVYAATTVIYRDPMTVADARESARRAFSVSELAALAEKAGWANFVHRKRPFGRQELIHTQPESEG